PDPKASVKVTKPSKPAPPEPAKPTKATKTVPDVPANAVPSSGGGKPDIGYGQFAAQNGQIGAGFGDGAFGTKYSWYVTAMVRKISQNWLKGLVDPSIPHPPRVFMTFDIARDGTISNIAVQQSSGIPTLDRSAQRALFATKLDPLPKDYSGSTVNVTFYFE